MLNFIKLSYPVSKLYIKLYIFILQGMSMGLGGNPYGPAGTGKTESVKALGSLLGRQVLVFNCDEVRHLHIILLAMS
jgi:Mg-chelatase subunit ChlI